MSFHLSEINRGSLTSYKTYRQVYAVYQGYTEIKTAFSGFKPIIQVFGKPCNIPETNAVMLVVRGKNL